MQDIDRYANIAQEIVEKNTAIAIRVSMESDDTWTTHYITKNIERYGYSWEDIMSGRITWPDIVHPDDWEDLIAKMDAYAQAHIDSYNVFYRILTADGDAIWMSDYSTVTRDENDIVTFSDCIISDYTKTRTDLEKIEDNYRQQNVLNDILQSLHASDLDQAFHIILDRTGTYLDISRVLLFEDAPDHASCEVIYEWCNEGIPSMLNPRHTLNYARDIPDIDESLQKTGRSIVNYECISEQSQGEFDIEGVIAAAIFAVFHDNERYGFICFDECVKHRIWPNDTVFFLENISKLVAAAVMRKRNSEALQLSQDHIRKLAFLDHLTKLPNRYQCDQELEKALREATINDQHGYVLFIDMDDFKVINDGYGHDYGDALLIAFANFLKANFLTKHNVFRFGGDEFVILVNHNYSDELDDVLRCMVERVAKPWKVMDKTVYITVSMGIVQYPDGGIDITEIIKNADVAMYQAKKQGKNSYVYYPEGQKNDSLERVEIENSLRKSIRNGFDRFSLFYQPVIEIASGRILGAEALLRWRDDEGKWVLLSDILSLCEYLGIIVPIGEYVLRNAALHCKAINDAGWPDFSVSVNISLRQFQQHDFLHAFLAVLEETGVEKKNISIEIVESIAFKDRERLQGICSSLHAHGIRIALDDFGTGYSSLSNMRDLPLDVVKIDRSFIWDVDKDAFSHSFIRMITELCHTMGIDVCIEGVETLEQAAFCAQVQANIAQGFHYYRPMPFDQVIALLEKMQA